MEKGITVDFEKWRCWAKGRAYAERGAVMALICDAIENGDINFVMQFPFVIALIGRPSRNRSQGRELRDFKGAATRLEPNN